MTTAVAPTLADLLAGAGVSLPQPETRPFIDGAYQEPSEGVDRAVTTPLTGEPIATVREGASDVDRAVAVARASFDDGRWAGLDPKARKATLLAFAQQLTAHTDELALLLSVDVGKPITQARIEVGAAAGCLTYYAESCDKVSGEVAPTRAGTLVTVTREPIGVVGAIVPWNYPLMLSAWKYAPALAAGNSVIIKPSERAPLAVLALGRLAAAAGIPAGVFNVVPGDGPGAGAQLALHPDVDKIAFTGSTAVGKKLLEYSGQSNMKAVSLECGGKSPSIVLADVPDLRRAAVLSARGAFFNQGEMCNAGTRIFVQREIVEEFSAALAEATAAEFTPGNPLDPATGLGALVDQAQLDRYDYYVRLGVEEGARVALGGARALPDSGGAFAEPTILVDATASMRVAREEIFAPVVVIIPFDDPEEAVAQANDSEYGLAAAVWTKDVAAAHRISGRLRAGTVYVNTINEADIVVPFGGFRQSGLGRDKSLHALDNYTELKTTWITID
ncbi:aldehyde dehydrogenase family protein [Pseudonocardia oroxyli]|uniref:Gamma-glutamyl-gamma-aminobutyraldehyde dehydrogenase n=1 Tax=Pseudonocardia oroxyli TaxID=366584 RepID=A0A1G7SRF1_PSEOR|nr:aldehyde dehydrogenase family protein [Pseudonocardia oroxyli]SDG24999.1 gamma-glutamyl-gamma-aminobutyraldehyde dehydrogenase [Pseudonocardia oroxyli]